MTNFVVPLVVGIGIGSLFASIACYFMMTQRLAKRLYQEKREAYLGLLDALRDAKNDSSVTDIEAWAHWQTRCVLFGSPEVTRYAQEVANQIDKPAAEYNTAVNNLIRAMRADLHRWPNRGFICR
jgi:hypothetical protein